MSKVDQLSVLSLAKKVRAIDDTFKEHHFVKADQGEGEAVATEQVVLDEYEDKLFLYMCTVYISRLHQLLERLEPTAVPALAKDPVLHLRR